MDVKWVRIFKTGELYQAKVIEALLNENDIACQVMNKQDSALVFGYIELYVPEPLQDQALLLILENQDEYGF